MLATKAGLGLLCLAFTPRLALCVPYSQTAFNTTASISTTTSEAGFLAESDVATTTILTTVYTTVGVTLSIDASSPAVNDTSSTTSVAVSSSALTTSSAPVATSSTSVSQAASSSSTFSSAAAASTSVAVAAPGTMPLKFVNNLDNGTVYAYVTGSDSDGQLVLLTQDSQFYYATSSSDTPEPIPDSADVALTLNGDGQTTEFVIPSYISSARIWVSQGQPLQFGVTSGGLVEPSAVTDSDPNYNVNWGFAEFTFNSTEDGGLYANLSFVDFIGLALGMRVWGSGNVTASTLGPHKGSKREVCEKLKKQSTKDGQPWDQLCKYDDNNEVIRVVSPSTLVTTNSSAFESYFDDYINAAWQQYTTTPLVIDTQSATGNISCTTSGENLVCDGDDTPYTKPSAGDIFGCASGPFANSGNDVHLATVPRVCAAINRATLHLPGGNVQPQLPPSEYYVPPATNFYSRYVHEAEIDGKGYAFSYDDVSPNQAEYNTAGLIAISTPEQMTVYVGGYRSSGSD